ncbi:hypothetical protein [Leucobacter aridicollis]|uniref:hypothetical protein n=1 Tax=Leucobacter aridicollis TaxID=283878 RepID=UPI002106021F|nr:hypothetical protein [Leucobacter aridicollis]UTX53296.1 hypothetical protein KI794_00560 [Leucobacter aridicollis]
MQDLEQRRQYLQGFPEEVVLPNGFGGVQRIERSDLLSLHDQAAALAESLDEHRNRIAKIVQPDVRGGAAVREFLLDVYDSESHALDAPPTPQELWEQLQPAGTNTDSNLSASAPIGHVRAALQAVPDPDVRAALISVHDEFSEQSHGRTDWFQEVDFGASNPVWGVEDVRGQAARVQQQHLPNQDDALSFAYPRFLENIYSPVRTDGRLLNPDTVEHDAKAIWGEALEAGQADELRMEQYRVLVDTAYLRLDGAEVTPTEVADIRATVLSRVDGLEARGHLNTADAAAIKDSLQLDDATPVWERVSSALDRSDLTEEDRNYLVSPFDTEHEDSFQRDATSSLGPSPTVNVVVAKRHFRARVQELTEANRLSVSNATALHNATSSEVSVDDWATQVDRVCEGRGISGAEREYLQSVPKSATEGGEPMSWSAASAAPANEALYRVPTVPPHEMVAKSRPAMTY